MSTRESSSLVFSQLWALQTQVSTRRIIQDVHLMMALSGQQYQRCTVYRVVAELSKKEWMRVIEAVTLSSVPSNLNYPSSTFPLLCKALHNEVKIERMVPYVRNNILYGKTYSSFTELENALHRLFPSLTFNSVSTLALS